MAVTRRALIFGIGASIGAGLGALRRASRSDAAPTLLRPPGALDEADFLAACTRCGECVAVCPFDTLRLAGPDQGVSHGSPYFVPRETPCSLCQGHTDSDRPFACINVCPTPALKEITRTHDLRMGVAKILPDLCLAHQGVTCRTCWHACPLPNEAIRLGASLRPEVVPDQCIGCGLCEHACPTEQAAIVVEPPIPKPAST
ncbi:MAG: 4Fe-4S binding protein [Phycisphaerales bacterium]|nr:4Fe-4S binding protein [Phycisphaerales bacterium]